MEYNLEKRTLTFSQELIVLCKKVPKNIVTVPIIDQLVRCGTSIGANYREANGASSKKDFCNKIFICKKEGKETLYWSELLARTVDDKGLIDECRKLWKEAKELTLIFSKIAFKSK